MKLHPSGRCSWPFSGQPFGFPYCACNLQAVGPRTTHLCMDMQINQVIFVLQFELITNALFHCKDQTFSFFLLCGTWSLDGFEPDTLALLLILKVKSRTFTIIYTYDMVAIFVFKTGNKTIEIKLLNHRNISILNKTLTVSLHNLLQTDSLIIVIADIHLSWLSNPSVTREGHLKTI